MLQRSLGPSHSNLASPHHCRFQTQRITCFMLAAQCFAPSMFYHRVLPPPSNLAKAPVAGVRPPNRDALLENRIMMDENHKLHLDRRESQGEQHSYAVPDDEGSSFKEETDSPMGPATRASARLSHKRDYDRSPEDAGEVGKNKSFSVLREDFSPRLSDSPSQLCLCQPDPKVPRPRNGNMPFSFLPASFIIMCQHWRNFLLTLLQLSSCFDSTIRVQLLLRIPVLRTRTYQRSLAMRGDHPLPKSRTIGKD